MASAEELNLQVGEYVAMFYATKLEKGIMCGGIPINTPGAEISSILGRVVRRNIPARFNPNREAEDIISFLGKCRGNPRPHIPVGGMEGVSSAFGNYMRATKVMEEGEEFFYLEDDFGLAIALRDMHGINTKIQLKEGVVHVVPMLGDENAITGNLVFSLY